MMILRAREIAFGVMMQILFICCDLPRVTVTTWRGPTQMGRYSDRKGRIACSKTRGKLVVSMRREARPRIMSVGLSALRGVPMTVKLLSAEGREDLRIPTRVLSSSLLDNITKSFLNLTFLVYNFCLMAFVLSLATSDGLKMCFIWG